jgi:hypothetical protein
MSYHSSDLRIRRSPRQRVGFTLAELVVSLATATLLMAGMMSAILIATRSAKTNPGTALVIDGSLALEDLVAELRDAVYFKQRSATVVSFTVPDRDSDGDVETIRYSWSGTLGDSLLREYNGGSAVAVVDDVHAFSLAYTVQTNAIDNKILLIVPDEESLDSSDSAKKTSMEGWGYTVIPVTVLRSDEELDALAGQADAIYISENVFSGDLNTKIKDAACGILNEEPALNDDFEIASSSGSTYTSTQINVTDNAHYVTSVFSTGVLTITSSSQQLHRIQGTLPSDLQVLSQQISGTQPSIGVIGTGGRLDDGTAAAGPRFNLPFGGGSFSFSSLNSTGLTLVQRAVDWSARKYVVTSVGITLQIGDDSSAMVETATEIPSQPRP